MLRQLIRGLTLSVTANIAVTANFAIDTFTLDLYSRRKRLYHRHYPQTVNYSADGSAVTAVPDLGYHFVKLVRCLDSIIRGQTLA